MNRVQAIVAHALIGVLLLVIAFMQVFGVPTMARETGREYPEVEHLVTPYTIAAIVALLCVQFILIGIGVLVYQIRPSAEPRSSALTWVSVMIFAALFAGLLSILVAVHLVFVEDTGGPAYMFITVIGVGFFLMAFSFRALRALVVHTRDADAELARVI